MESNSQTGCHVYGYRKVGVVSKESHFLMMLKILRITRFCGTQAERGSQQGALSLYLMTELDDPCYTHLEPVIM